jgi:hypothetical protein
VFSNNWSTRGNYNPYTGKPGWRTSPSAAYAAAVRSNWETQQILAAADRALMANQLPPISVQRPNLETARKQNVNSWQPRQFREPMDRSLNLTPNEFEERQRLLDSLAQRGVKLNAPNYDLTQLQEIDERVTIAMRLNEKGVTVRWSAKSVEQLQRLEAGSDAAR